MAGSPALKVVLERYGYTFFFFLFPSLSLILSRSDPWTHSMILAETAFYGKYFGW